MRRRLLFFGDIMVEYWTAEMRQREKMIRLDGEELTIHRPRRVPRRVPSRPPPWPAYGPLRRTSGRRPQPWDAPRPAGSPRWRTGPRRWCCGSRAPCDCCTHVCRNIFDKARPQTPKNPPPFLQPLNMHTQTKSHDKTYDSGHPRRQKPHWSSPPPLSIPFHQNFFEKKNFFVFILTKHCFILELRTTEGEKVMKNIKERTWRVNRRFFLFFNFKFKNFFCLFFTWNFKVFL